MLACAYVWCHSTCIRVNGIFMNVCSFCVWIDHYLSHRLALFIPFTSQLQIVEVETFCVAVGHNSISTFGAACVDLSGCWMSCTSNEGIKTKRWELNVVWKCNIYSHSLFLIFFFITVLSFVRCFVTELWFNRTSLFFCFFLMLKLREKHTVFWLFTVTRFNHQSVTLFSSSPLHRWDTFPGVLQHRATKRCRTRPNTNVWIYKSHVSYLIVSSHSVHSPSLIRYRFNISLTLQIIPVWKSICRFNSVETPDPTCQPVV